MLQVVAVTCEAPAQGCALRCILCLGGRYTAGLRTQSLGEHPGLSYLVFKGRRIDLPMFDPSISLKIGVILLKKGEIIEIDR
jgi:hypothetical protein